MIPYINNWSDGESTTSLRIEFSRWRGQKLWEGMGRGMLLVLKTLDQREWVEGVGKEMQQTKSTVRWNCELYVRRHQLFREILFYSRMRCHWGTFSRRVAWFHYRLKSLTLAVLMKTDCKSIRESGSSQICEISQRKF